MLLAVRLAWILCLMGGLSACSSPPPPKHARQHAASASVTKKKVTKKKRKSDTKSGLPDLKHGLSKEEVRTALRKMDAGVTGCYAVEFGGRKHGGGRIVVAIRVSRSGKIKRAEVAESTFGNATFEGCVADMARHLEFPGAKGETEVVKAYSLEKKD